MTADNPKRITASKAIGAALHLFCSSLQPPTPSLFRIGVPRA